MVVIWIVSRLRSGKALIKVWLTNIPIYLEVQFYKWILSAIIIAQRAFFVIFVVIILTTLTYYYQFGGYLVSGVDLKIPLHFTYTDTQTEKAFEQSSFRESSLLQGNFSLLSKKSLAYILNHGEYQIELDLMLPDNEKNHNVSYLPK